jgi:hypothetical protein
MGDLLSFVAIAVLMVLIVVSVRRQRATAAVVAAEAHDRIGSDGAQHERSMRARAGAVKAAQED